MNADIVDLEIMLHLLRPPRSLIKIQLSILNANVVDLEMRLHLLHLLTLGSGIGIPLLDVIVMLLADGVVTEAREHAPPPLAAVQLAAPLVGGELRPPSLRHC